MCRHAGPVECLCGYLLCMSLALFLWLVLFVMSVARYFVMSFFIYFVLDFRCSVYLSLSVILSLPLFPPSHPPSLAPCLFLGLSLSFFRQGFSLSLLVLFPRLAAKRAKSNVPYMLWQLEVRSSTRAAALGSGVYRVWG